MKTHACIMCGEALPRYGKYCRKCRNEVFQARQRAKYTEHQGYGYEAMILGYNRDDDTGRKRKRMDFSYRPVAGLTEATFVRGSGRKPKSD